tara:strand:+ start:25 stop:858 length:834 start_codon:yes stop_codon:yes gene_type:complete
MAKKTKKVEVEEPQAKMVEETVMVKEPEVRERIKPKNEWEIKDRVYYLKGNKSPVSYSIRSSNIFYFDEKVGYERELKYCQNQKTPFVDEMKGDQRLEHIIFRDGMLFVEKAKTTLQKLLSLYHPHKDQLYYEYKPQQLAAEEIDELNEQVDALTAARNVDIEMAEAIMRVEIGSEVSKLSSKELRRDLLVFARNNPKLFLELADDENVMLRNFGIRAVENGVLRLSSDQRNFLWGSNGRKVMTIPFDEHPYTALAHWFKTDEGMEIYSNIEKRLNQ